MTWFPDRLRLKEGFIVSAPVEFSRASLVTSRRPELTSKRILGRIACNYFNKHPSTSNKYMEQCNYRWLERICIDALPGTRLPVNSSRGSSSTRELRAKFPGYFECYYFYFTKIIVYNISYITVN